MSQQMAQLANENRQRFNNIEWLRIIFALQVLIVHVYRSFADIELPYIVHFPGVPAFFFISGFLIYGSYLKSRSLRDYYMNRFLRLMPGLLFVTLGALSVIVYVKGASHLLENLSLYLVWFGAQLTLGQSYGPAEFADIGVGNINGPLWTITVELLFYVSVPVIVFLEKRARHILAILFVASITVYLYGVELLSFSFFGKPFIDHLHATPVVWGWMFLLGIFCFKNFDVIYKHIGKLWIGGVVMIVLVVVDYDNQFFLTSNNRVGPVYFVAYAALILYAAFGIRYRPLAVDLSYGTYIWHMLIVNLLLVLGLPNIPLTVLLTAVAATASWYLVEKPALSLKRYSFRNT